MWFWPSSIRLLVASLAILNIFNCLPLQDSDSNSVQLINVLKNGQLLSPSELLLKRPVRLAEDELALKEGEDKDGDGKPDNEVPAVKDDDDDDPKTPPLDEEKKEVVDEDLKSDEEKDNDEDDDDDDDDKGKLSSEEYSINKKHKLEQKSKYQNNNITILLHQTPPKTKTMTTMT